MGGEELVIAEINTALPTTSKIISVVYAKGNVWLNVLNFIDDDVM